LTRLDRNFIALNAPDYYPTTTTTTTTIITTTSPSYYSIYLEQWLTIPISLDSIFVICTQYIVLGLLSIITPSFFYLRHTTKVTREDNKQYLFIVTSLSLSLSPPLPLTH